MLSAPDVLQQEALTVGSHGDAARLPPLWRDVGAREGREGVRVRARETVRPCYLQLHPDCGVGLAPAYGSHTAAMAYGWSATTPANSELRRLTNSVASCTYNS